MASKRKKKTRRAAVAGDRQGPSIVGINIRRMREARGWTGGELAAKVGRRQGLIGGIESGATQYPGSDLLVALAEAFGVLMEAFWTPVEGAPSADPSLQQLVESGIAGPISEAEMGQLRSARALLRSPTPRAWMDLLEAIRASATDGSHTNNKENE